MILLVILFKSLLNGLDVLVIIHIYGLLQLLHENYVVCFQAAHVYLCWLHRLCNHIEMVFSS